MQLLEAYKCMERIFKGVVVTWFGATKRRLFKDKD